MRELSTQYQKAEYKKWGNAIYPYDMAECGCCATVHYTSVCVLPAHAEMRCEAIRLGFNGSTQRRIGPRIRKQILAFRKKFARFYQS